MKISVVIASVNGLASIRECLEHIDRQRGYLCDMEVIVHDCCNDGTSEYILKNHPSIHLTHHADRLSVPHLRFLGMREATGKWIAIIEDHCMVPHDWLAKIEKTCDDRYSIIGGAVENGMRRGLVNWAVFLCEYSFSIPPIPEGVSDAVSGNNVIYQKRDLDSVSDEILRDYWEYFLHQELRDKGKVFYSASGIVVDHKKEFRFLYFMAQRYHYSRSFAGMRKSRLPAGKCLIHILSAPLLPFLMTFRTYRNLAPKRRCTFQFLRCLPVLLPFMISYAWGEFIGYIAGGGASLNRVE